MLDGANGKEAKMKKKILALLMAAALTLGVCAPAVADEGSYTLTLDKAQPGHTYTVYQIFTGDLHVTESETILSNVVWGSGVTESGRTHFGSAAEKADALEEGGASAAELFAAEVADYLGDSAGSVTISAGKTTGSISGLAAGYYLVKTTGVTAEDGVYTYYVMKVVKDTTATMKSDVPSVDKVIVEDGVEFDVVDKNVGDAVEFKLTATMPSTFEGYESYEVIFHDTLSAGLTFEKDTVKVMLGDKDVTDAFVVTSDSSSLTIACDNVLAEKVGASAGSSIVVTYRAVLNSNAELGNPGNPNTVYLEYSNDPNCGGSGSKPTGKTPEDKVVVFTYELDTTKVDGSNPDTKLEGAEFVLYRGQDSSLEYAKVTDGRVSGWTSSKDEASTFTSGSDGLFKIAGLDAGAYYLKETKAPAGYNLIEEPIKFVIEAELSKDELTLTKLTITVDGNDESGNCDTGVVSMTVKNNKGPVLPETGGIGTTLFYAVGGLLVVGAVVLLIMRRRAGSEE